MTQTTLATGPRLKELDAVARWRERRRFRSALALSGFGHALIIALLIMLWQQPEDEVVPLPPIPVTVVQEHEGQSGAAGGGNGDTAASASNAADAQAATVNPAQTAPADPQQPQQPETPAQPAQPQPVTQQAPTPETAALSLPPSPTALQQAPEQPPEPVPPRKPKPPRPTTPVVAPAPPVPPPLPPVPVQQTAQATPAASPEASGARQGSETPLPAGEGGQGRGEVGTGRAEVGNGSANGTADDYLAKVRLWILRFAKPPTDDCSRDHGDGSMDVTYHRDGTVIDVHITKSSGCPASDAEALRMVRAASPLPAIPGRFPGDPKTLGFPFDFRPGLLDRIFHGH
ncbi:MAG TPA: TonB family protein [Stellaceae bacterium]|jgi:protein TonB|nr:TonB family protein [Stellaceae bacterium]